MSGIDEKKVSGSSEKDKADSAEDDFMKELQGEFLNEALFLLEACEESYLKLDNPANRPQELDKIFRAAHSFKGTGASVGFKDLAEFAHVAEDCLSVLRVDPALVNTSIITLLLSVGDAFKERVNQLKNNIKSEWQIQPLRDELIHITEALKKNLTEKTRIGNVSEKSEISSMSDDSNFEQKSKASSGNTIKVDAERIESVLDLIGELVVTKSQLSQSYKAMNVRNAQHDSILLLLDKSIRELQDRAMSMRLTSLRPLFLKIQRAVRDVALKLGKSVEFSMLGEEVEIDRTMIDLLGDPLVHLARNAVDHGIESQEKRKLAGKPETAKIMMVARQMGGRILIEIQDDGGGIPRDKVIDKAIDRGILSATADRSSISDQQVYSFLFAPGFSTAEKISDISGRGVGLDVVKSNIEKLKGSIEVESQVEKGSIFRISIPLTAAITEGLLVTIGKERYIIPMNIVIELIRLNEDDITRVSSVANMIQVRGELLLLVDTLRLISREPINLSKESSGQRALVVGVGGRQVALRLNEVLGQVQVVVKPLPQGASQKNFVSGTAILGDGRVALLLNVDGLIKDGFTSSQDHLRLA